MKFQTGARVEIEKTSDLTSDLEFQHICKQLLSHLASCSVECVLRAIEELLSEIDENENVHERP